MKRKHISTAATFIGAVIGAGFASGREISLYFGGTSLFTPLLSGILLGLFCYLFLFIGKETNGNPLSLWGKGKFIAGGVIKLSNIVTLCSMTAASEIAFQALFSISGGGIITGILALVTVIFGPDKIKMSNFVIVPVIIVLTVVLLFKAGTIPDGGKTVFLPAFSYCTMNILGGGYLIGTMSADFTKKDCAITAILCGTGITLLILAVFFTVQGSLDDDMPLMSAAASCNLNTVGNTVMYLAVFTTMTGCLSVSSDNKPLPAIGITAIAFALSLLGFRTLVDVFYPLLGILGGIISLVYVFLIFRQASRCCSRRRRQGSTSGSRDFLR